MHQQGLIGAEQFEIAQAEARLAEQRFDFARALIRQSEANVHASETRIEAAKAMSDAANSRLEAQRAALLRIEDLASKTVLKAPIGGLITACNVEKGERAVPGIQSNPVATLMTIADMSVIEAEIEVDEADIVAVFVGAKAEVEVDAIRDLKMRGVVTEMGQSPIQSTDQQEGKEFKVVVRLEDPAPSLRPGFTATADIETATRQDVLVVPRQALTVRERERGADGELVTPPRPVEGAPPPKARDRRAELEEVEGVFLLEDGVARFREVTTGIAGDMDIEIVAGLQLGEQVVIGPDKTLRKLREWDRIRQQQRDGENRP